MRERAAEPRRKRRTSQANGGSRHRYSHSADFSAELSESQLSEASSSHCSDPIASVGSGVGSRSCQP